MYVRLLTTAIVSEPIGLKIVSMNGGSYTGAILFTGFMYLGAAASLWAVRAWKIGELEEKAAAAGADCEKSPFLKRMLMWQKV